MQSKVAAATVANVLSAMATARLECREKAGGKSQANEKSIFLINLSARANEKLFIPLPSQGVGKQWA